MTAPGTRLSNRTANEIAASMEKFARSDSVLTSGNVPVEHREKFVAAYDGGIVGSAPDLVALLDILRARNIPMGTVAVRWIEADGREAGSLR